VNHQYLFLRLRLETLLWQKPRKYLIK